MPLRYDLHVHTIRSDGSSSPEDVVLSAAQAGLDAIAVSDHDTFSALSHAQDAGEKLGVKIVPAAEISAIDEETGRKVHLLAYYPHRPEALLPMFDSLNERRRIAGERMIELVCRKFPIKREQIMRWANNSTTIYRVHIMRALMEFGYCKTPYGQLYRSLFSRSQGECHVPVDYPEYRQAAAAARASGAVVALAHPCVYNSFDAAQCLARAGLIDAVEFDYPRKTDETAGWHERFAREYGLIPTGGTDFHGFYSHNPHPLGTCCTTDDAIEKIMALSNARKPE